jgi:hypothetical protein
MIITEEEKAAALIRIAQQLREWRERQEKAKVRK